jgi:unsaturated rhamnogalacturonyl hydrolase
VPPDHPDYARYTTLFKEMAAKIREIQPEDGLWRPSLLDPQSYPQPESSGSAFFCYALAWGINHGLLDREVFLPAVERAWSGLIGTIHPDGMPGYVQPIGADPRSVTADMTEVYGVGAFLLAGKEVLKLAADRSQRKE